MVAEHARTLSRANDHAARLGLELRRVLLAPKAAFPAALEGGAGRGPSAYVLTLLGGASLALFWLKIGALMGLREVCDPRLVAGYVAAAGVLGALLGLAAFLLWPWFAAAAGRAVRGNPMDRGSARVIWGASQLPLVLALVLLLPLDLVIVGSDSFTTAVLREPLATAWAATSLALTTSALVWSLWVCTRGFQAVTGARTGRSLLGAAAMVASLAVAIAAFAVPAALFSGGGTCRIPPA